jgi:hypothetical protein
MGSLIFLQNGDWGTRFNITSPILLQARFYLHSRNRCCVVPLRTYWRSGGIPHLAITQNFSSALGFFRRVAA